MAIMIKKRDGHYEPLSVEKTDCLRLLGARKLRSYRTRNGLQIAIR